jgi:hypothetical protein
MKYFAIYFLFFASAAFCKDSTLSVFQSQIKDCDFNFSELKSIKNFSNLYAEIQKKYLLTSERTLYRELYFQVKNENKKIKITNDVLELFKIGENERHTQINIDARQKSLTLQSQISQLTLNAKIDSDWKKSLEFRENSLKIEIVRVDDKITQLKVVSDKNLKTLDCQIVNASEVCLCNKTIN